MDETCSNNVLTGMRLVALDLDGPVGRPILAAGEAAALQSLLDRGVIVAVMTACSRYSIESLIGRALDPRLRAGIRIAVDRRDGRRSTGGAPQTACGQHAARGRSAGGAGLGRAHDLAVICQSEGIPFLQTAAIVTTRAMEPVALEAGCVVALDEGAHLPGAPRSDAAAVADARFPSRAAGGLVRALEALKRAR